MRFVRFLRLSLLCRRAPDGTLLAVAGGLDVKAVSRDTLQEVCL